MTQKLVLRGDVSLPVDSRETFESALDKWRREWERWHDVAMAVLYAGPLGSCPGDSWPVSELDATYGHVDIELSYGETRQRVIDASDDRWVVLGWPLVADDRWAQAERKLALVDLTATLWRAAESMEHAARLVMVMNTDEGAWLLGVASELAAALDRWDSGAAARETLRLRDAQQPLIDAHAVAATETLCDEDVPF